MMSQQQQHPTRTPKEYGAEAATLCREINLLIEDENTALKAHNIEPVEENIKKKTRLAAKLEKLLSDVKKNKDVLRQHGDFKIMAQQIQREMDGFQGAAKKNMLLLKTAHQTRADTLHMIRYALDLQKPQAQMYNNQGRVAPSAASASLINKAV